ncbi:MAG: hypothetical protein NC453_20950 [Muribaculum sp.]|nr:hypothetical protein [Muribaculum sp.]
MHIRLKQLIALAALSALGALGFNASAQSQVYLNIFTDDGENFKKGELLVSRNDSTVMFEIVDSPQFSFTIPDVKDSKLTFSSNGYKEVVKQVPDTAFIYMDILLERIGNQLDEVVVKGYAQSEKTATGEVFRLSKKAKDSKNPFRALSEIPLLQVDIVNEDIKLRDGSSPLILIDGKMVNTGVAPIDPRYIEKVEISEVVSAKYLQMGVNKIINIHLKRDMPKYLYTQLRTRDDIPARYGFGSAIFETGTPKFAVYGYLTGNYTHKDKTDYNLEEILDSSKKLLKGQNANKHNWWEGKFLLKWMPSKADYFSFLLMGQDGKSLLKGHSDGHFTNDSVFNMSSATRNKTRNGGWLSALYYEHTFHDNSTITSFLRYNRGQSKDRNMYEESIGEDNSDYFDFQNWARDTYTVTLDYDSQEKKFGNISAGNNFDYSIDHMTNLNVSPNELADIKIINNYTYAAYANSWKRLYYMVSSGLQYVHVNAESAKHSYWRPRVSATVSTSLPYGNMIRARYYLTNNPPAVIYLFAFNNSTNPWLRKEGNPYLTPVMIHDFSLSYDKQFGNHRLQLSAHYRHNNHMIETYMRNEGDYMVQSYHNNGTYNGTILGSQFIFSFSNLMGSVGASYCWDKYAGQTAKGYVKVNGYVRWDFGNFFVYSTIAWQNKDYSPIGFTKFNNPTDAHIQIAWQINDNFYISAALPYYCGIRSETSVTRQQGYYSKVKTDFKGSSLRPWILISWTLRKNPRQAIINKMQDQSL